MSNPLPRTAHTEKPWRIHEIAPDFRLHDVWAFRAPGATPDDFPLALGILRGGGGPPTSATPTRLLFAVRWKLGALLGWDRPGAGLGGRVRSLRDRLPDDLRDSVRATPMNDSPFTPLYALHDEAALELANKTVHGVAHFGWVPARDGYELRMAVLVRPNGCLGRLYLAGIEPFRLLIVYPAMVRRWDHAWRHRDSITSVDAGRATGEVR
ncbi:DUF2867 domain-containing protein [Nocardia veterana]|uniref:DUF2867 domain-containing protein n=1 Tax=Nocardia veterana TaxID=132249 RepID=A0A7X6M332_9NOCA|nr:DUF2867 domain-containing protein [Nocardia veterana]NKY89351.1 DUF2867 domain-containing protein [Nocardia veterana]